MLTTKVGLTNNLKYLKWWSTIPIDQFFPRSYDLSEMKEIGEFKEDFRVCRAESILKKFVKKKECPAVEKLIISIHINEKRLKDVDEIIDDPDLENLVKEEEWEYIIKEKWLDPKQKQHFLTQ
jgi:hypothetical protein